MSVIRLHLYLHAKIRKCVAIIGVIFGGGIIGRVWHQLIVYTGTQHLTCVLSYREDRRTKCITNVW